MPLPDRQAQFLRLTTEQTRRLDDAARADGKTKQAFMQAAVMRAVEETEERRRLRKEDRQRRRDEREGRRLDDAPMGLGITPRRTPAEEAPPEPPASGQVVFNVGATTPAQPA